MMSSRAWLSLAITLWSSYKIKNNFSSFTQFLLSACVYMYIHMRNVFCISYHDYGLEKLGLGYQTWFDYLCKQINSKQYWLI